MYRYLVTQEYESGIKIQGISQNSGRGEIGMICECV